MIDLAIVLEETEKKTPLGASIKQAIQKSGQVLVNNTNHGPLKSRPMGIPIKTKISTSADEGRTQLSIWTAGWFARMEAWVSGKRAEIQEQSSNTIDNTGHLNHRARLETSAHLRPNRELSIFVRGFHREYEVVIGTV